MIYIKVVWKHNHPDEPVLIYSELDDAFWEVRKVEIFREGPAGFASYTTSTRSTRLGVEPVPPLAKIELDKEFDLREITKDEFEGIWGVATAL